MVWDLNRTPRCAMCLAPQQPPWVTWVLALLLGGPQSSYWVSREGPAFL